MKSIVLVLLLGAIAVEALPAGKPPRGPWLGCSAPGFFPDPLHCSVAWLCGPQLQGRARPWPALARRRCPAPGPAYHPLHQNCSLAEDHPTCRDRPVPQCTRKGQAGPLPLNPSLFFLCEAAGASPMLFRCPTGQVFSPESRGCAVKGEGTKRIDWSTTDGGWYTTEDWYTTQDWYTTPDWYTTQDWYTTPDWYTTQDWHTTQDWDTTINWDTTPDWDTTQGTTDGGWPTPTWDQSTWWWSTTTESTTPPPIPTSSPSPSPSTPPPPPPPRPGNATVQNNVQCSMCNVNIFNLFKR